MAHELETMFYVREVPWHGLGTRLKHAPTVADALRLAGLDWTVELRKVVLVEDTERCDSLDQCREVMARCVVRMSDGAILGVVGLDYEPCQNVEKLDVIAPLIESGAAWLDTAGSLRGGKRVWLQANMGLEADVIKGDPVTHRILVSGSHDGSLAVRIQDTEIRVVCNNTLTYARDERGGIRIKHTRNVHKRMDDVTTVIGEARESFAKAIESYRYLAGRKMSASQTRDYVKGVFGTGKAKPVQAAPMAPKMDAADIFPGMFGESGKLTTLTADDVLDTSGDRVTERVMRLVESGAGADIPGVQGTAWGAYNAVTEYLTHERGTNPDGRLDSNWFGNNAALNTRALEMALEVASKAVR